MQVACQERSLLAPAWHTRLLVALLLVAPLAGLLLAPNSSPPRQGSVLAYLPSVLVSFGLAAYVARLGLPSSILKALVGKTWSSPCHAFADVALASAVSMLVLTLDAALALALGAPESLTGRAFLPSTTADRAAWLLLAGAAGVGEELVYRGYLQQQLSRSCRSRILGLLLQALLFGIAHGEQGGAAVARVTLYGLLFGSLALLRGSLLPGILAHVAIDLYAGWSA